MKPQAILIVAPHGAGALQAARTWEAFPPSWDVLTRLEASLVAQSVGLIDCSLMARRPFRAPHHTVSFAGLLGGGDKPRPGEVSLAHGGTLLLDQLQEFRRSDLVDLFKVLAAGESKISRHGETWTFPACPALVIVAGLLDRTPMPRPVPDYSVDTEATEGDAGF